VPVGLVALLYSVKGLRGALAGFALGVAGHLLARLILPSLSVDVRWVPLDALWLGLNAAVSAVVGYLVARR
jgi:chromate transport protein ChrA